MKILKKIALFQHADRHVAFLQLKLVVILRCVRVKCSVPRRTNQETKWANFYQLPKSKVDHYKTGSERVSIIRLLGLYCGADRYWCWEVAFAGLIFGCSNQNLKLVFRNITKRRVYELYHGRVLRLLAAVIIGCAEWSVGNESRSTCRRCFDA